MASVTLVRDGVELIVSTTRAFVSAVYAQGWSPKTGSVEDNYATLLGAPPPAAGLSPLALLSQRVTAVETSLTAGGGTGGGISSYVHQQLSPSASWAVNHPLGRLPAVSIYIAGREVEADVDATATQVFVTFPSPQAGHAVLT